MNRADEESEKDDSNRKNGNNYFHLPYSMYNFLK